MFVTDPNEVEGVSFSILDQLVYADPETLSCAERIRLLKEARNELDQAIHMLETYGNNGLSQR